MPYNTTYRELGFTDPEHGFLLVESDLATDSNLGAGLLLTLLTTHDGGENWLQDRALSQQHGEIRLGATAVLPDPSPEGLVLLPRSTTKERRMP